MELHKILSHKEMRAWIRHDLLNSKQIEKLRKEFLHNKPIAHLQIKDFLKEEKVYNLLKALQKVEFKDIESDLFKFMQSSDFKGTKNKTIKEFYSFIKSKEFLTFIEIITEIKVKPTIDMSSSIYQNTDFLLPHDDQLKGRKIAFMLYLSDFKAVEGGKLLFYKTKNKKPIEADKAIISELNKFVIFKVSPKSWHEVEEVSVNKQRITIGGWFHG